MKRLTIEKGVPIPPVNYGRTRDRGLIEALDRMDVMDSVQSPYQENSTRVTAVAAAKNTTKKFTVRAYGSGYRIWRTA